MARWTGWYGEGRRRSRRPAATTWRWAPAALVAVLGCAGSASAPAASVPPAAGAPAATSSAPVAAAKGPVDPLQRANGDFHAQYAAGRAREQATLGASRPYLLLGGGKLVLRHRGATEERSLSSARFDALKQASHVPVTAVSAILARDDDGTLRDLAARLREADAAITPGKLGDSEPAAHAVVRASVELLEAARARTPTEAELHAFGLRTRADTTRLLQAGCDEALARLDAALRQLRPLVGDAWSQAVVVITTDHQSRAEEAETQYFEQLFHEHAKEGALGEARVVILENIGPNDGATQAMASHLFDQHLSVLLFDDPAFLQGDVLGKNALPTIARLLATPL